MVSLVGVLRMVIRVVMEVNCAKVEMKNWSLGMWCGLVCKDSQHELVFLHKGLDWSSPLIIFMANMPIIHWRNMTSHACTHTESGK